MDRSLAWRRVADSRVARLGTVKPEGPPHLVPCCFDLVGDMVYSAIDAKPKSTSALRRIQNIRANPSACLLVDHYEEDWSALWWVRLDGTARILESTPEAERAKRVLVTKYPQYEQLAIPGPVIALDISSWTAWP